MRIDFTLRKGEWALLLFTTAYVVLFTWHFIAQQIVHGWFYIPLILSASAVMYVTSRIISFGGLTLWLLSFWGLLHLLGGTRIGEEGFFYNQQLFPLIVYKDIYVLQYDQLVHYLGFGAATLAGWRIIAHFLPHLDYSAMSYVLIFSLGLTIGTGNEIIEFITSTLWPENQVGGYANTMLDIVFDAFGSATAILYIFYYQRSKRHLRLPDKALQP